MIAYRSKIGQRSAVAVRFANVRRLRVVSSTGIGQDPPVPAVRLGAGDFLLNPWYDFRYMTSTS